MYSRLNSPIACVYVRLKLDDELSFIVTAAGVLCVVLAALHRPHSAGQTIRRLVAVKLAGQEERLVFVGDVRPPGVTALTRAVIRRLGVPGVVIIAEFRVRKRLRWRHSIIIQHVVVRCSGVPCQSCSSSTDLSRIRHLAGVRGG